MDQNMEAIDPKNNRKGAGEEQVELLSTKLAPPQLRAPFVPREALLARLSEGLGQKGRGCRSRPRRRPRAGVLRRGGARSRRGGGGGKRKSPPCSPPQPA